MKYCIKGLLIVTLTLVLTNMNAQQKGLAIGIETGPGLRRLYGSGISDSDFNAGIGFAGGMALQYSFSDMFSIRTGASYDLKGAVNRDIVFTENTGNEVGEGTARSNFHYITMPVMFRATFNVNKVFSFYGNLGLYSAFLFKQETKFKDVELEQNSFDNTDDYNAFDAGSAIGVGAIFTLKEMFNISIEARNYMGVIDISDYENFDSDPIRTMSTMLLIGVSHNIGKSTIE